MLPIALKNATDIDKVSQIAQWLNKNSNDKTLIVYSLDFSHYLTKDVSDTKDEVTKELIINKDTKEILKLNSDFVDSPGALAIAIELAKLHNCDTLFVHHDNSYNLMIEKPKFTTSYFGIIYFSSK